MQIPVARKKAQNKDADVTSKENNNNHTNLKKETGRESGLPIFLQRRLQSTSTSIQHQSIEETSETIFPTQLISFDTVYGAYKEDQFDDQEMWTSDIPIGEAPCEEVFSVNENTFVENEEQISEDEEYETILEQSEVEEERDSRPSSGGEDGEGMPEEEELEEEELAEEEELEAVIEEQEIEDARERTPPSGRDEGEGPPEEEELEEEELAEEEELEKTIAAEEEATEGEMSLEGITPPEILSTEEEIRTLPPDVTAAAGMLEQEEAAEEEMLALEEEQQIEQEAEPAISPEGVEPEAEEVPPEAEAGTPSAGEEEAPESGEEAIAQEEEAQTEAQVTLSGDGGAAAAESMRAVRQGITQRAQAIPSPRITRGTEAIRNASARREAAEQDLNNRRDEAPESAQNAIPDVPEGMPQGLRGQENPVPEAREAIERASNLSLPAQTPPALVRTPQRNMPILGRRPLSPGRIRQLRTILEEGPQVSDPRDQQRMQLIQMREQLLTRVEPQEGEGKQAELRDIPPPSPPALSRRRRRQFAQVIARLLASPRREAQSMVDRARRSAFTNGVLNVIDETRNLGNEDSVPDLTDILREQYRAIAREAGIADTELSEAVEQRREQLAEERRREEEELQMSIMDDTESISIASQEVNDAIEGGRRGIDRRAEEVQAAAQGPDSVEVIRLRRDNLIAEVTRNVAVQTANYRRAGERRERELSDGETQQIAAYQYAVQQDEFQLNENRGERTQVEVQEDIARSRRWLENRLRNVRGRFRTLKTEASNAATGYQEGIDEAGDEAREYIRQWAANEGGEERSFWDWLWEMVSDWMAQTEANADAWQTLQNQETAVATAGYLDMMEQVDRAARSGITQQEILESNRLNAEEQAIVRAYFDPNSGHDVIGAVAEGLRERLYAERGSSIKDRLENQVLSGDFHWSILERVGREYNSGFDAADRASKIHSAFHGGITGWGTDEEAAYNAMAGLNRVQAEALRAAYRQIHHRDLDSDITGEFSRAERDRARALMSGDQNRAAAAALDAAMHQTFLGTGWGTDRDVIMNTLRGKSPEEIEQITRIYEETYGGNLREQLNEELNDWATLSTHDADMANAYLESNTALADAIAADQALHGFSWGYAFNLAYGTRFEAGSRDDFTAVYDRVRREVSQQAIREQWTDEQFQAEVTRRTQEIERLYNQRYGFSWGPLRENVAERFTNENLNLINATLDNDQERMAAARIAIERNSLVYASDDTIISTVEANYDRALEATRRDLEPDLRRRLMAQMQAEEQEYFQNTGQHWTGPELYARRQRMEREVQRQLEAEARRRAEASMGRMSEIYNTEYGETLRHAIETSTGNSFFGIGGDDETHALTALQQGGYLTRYQRFDFAVRGGGTTEDAARRAMQGASHEELAAMRRQWAKDHPGETLDERALSELSGKDAMDMRIALQGEPETIEERVNLERFRVSLERPSGMGGAIAGPEREIMEFRLRQLEEDAERLQNEDLSPEERNRLLADFDYHAEANERAVERHRAVVSEMTDSIANAVGIAVAVVIGVVGSIFTAGASAAIALAIIASLAATTATVGTRLVLLGNQYGTEELLTDIGLGVVDAVVAGLTAGFGNRLLGISQIARAAAPIARTGLRGSIQQLQRSFGNLLARLGNVGPWTRRIPSIGFLERMAKGSWYSRLAAHAISETAENAVGAIPTAVVGNVINDQNWEGGFQIGNVLRGIVTEVGHSVATGMGISGGMAGAARLHGAAGRLMRGPRLGMEPRITTPDHLLPTPESYDAALQEYQRQNPGRSAADFDAIVQRERTSHLHDYLASHPGKTEADFWSEIRQHHEQRRAEFQQMRRGRPDTDFDAEMGRESASALSRAKESEIAQQQLRNELLDAVPANLRANVRDVPITRVSASEFTRVSGRLTGDVHIVVRDGQVHLIVREGASPATVRDYATRLADMVEPGTGGRVRDPAQALPRDLRNRVPVDVNPDLAPRTVRVHYEAHDGIILGVWMEVGPGVRAIDIQMHAQTVRAMHRLQGMSGRVRQLLNRIRAWIGVNVEPPPGSLAYEARRELEKLPRIIEERASALRSASSVEEQMRIAMEIENLRTQLEQHARNVDVIEQGRGFVAAEALTPEQVAQRIADLPEDVQNAIRQMEESEQAQMMVFSESLATLTSAGVEVRSFIETWRALQIAEAESGVSTASLLDRAAHSSNPETFIDSVGRIARTLEGPDRADVLNMITDRRRSVPPDFLKGLADVVQSPHVDPTSDSMRFLMASAFMASDRVAFMKGLYQVVHAGISTATLQSLSNNVFELDPRSMSDFLSSAGKLANRINELSANHPQLRELLNPLLQGAGSVSQFSYYFDNVSALVDAIGMRAQQPDGTTAIKNLLDYAQRAGLCGEEGVAIDLMTAGRQVRNTADKNRNALIDKFSRRLSEGKRMGHRETWDNQLVNAENSYPDDVAKARTEYQPVADAIASVTPDRLPDGTKGWSEGQRAMIWRQHTWLHQLARARGVEVDFLLKQLLPKSPFRCEADYDAFRRRLRNELLNEIFAKGHDNPDITLLNNALKDYPDPGAKGTLFDRYMQQRIGRRPTEGGKPEITESSLKGLQASEEGTTTLKKLDDEVVSYADDVANVTRDHRSQGGPPEGPILIDYKAGRGAFRADQALQYMKHLSEGGGTITDALSNDYNGLIYIADSKAHAEAAMNEAQALITKHYPGKEANMNLYFAYEKPDGTLGWVEPSWK